MSIATTDSGDPVVDIDELDDLLCDLADTCCDEPEGGNGMRTVLVRAGTSDANARTTLFVASTDREDRAGDVVKQDWRLANFRRNPVILDNHFPLRVVGRGDNATNRRLEGGSQQLEILVRWDLDNPDPAVRSVGHQHLNGFRSAGSVGFRPSKRTLRNKLAPDHPAYKEPRKVETPWGSYEVVGEYLEGNELLEFSSASVPMNPDAVQQSYLARMSELAPDDVVGRARVTAETVTAAAGADLVSMVRGLDDAGRGQLADLLWPDWLQRMRTDPTARRILQALQIPPGPPAPTPDLFTRVAELLETT